VRSQLSAASRAAARTFAVLAALAPTMLLVAGVPVSGLGSAGRVGGHPGARSASPAGAPGVSAPTAHTASAAPTPQARYRIVGCNSRGVAGAFRHGPGRREVAIGFDDGPWGDTGAFVRMLERSHARATFFLIGGQLSGTYRATLLRELRDGDVLGDHSFSHPDLTRSGGVYGQLRHTIQAIRSLTGYTPCVFRPPYGAYDGSVLSSARSLGLATVIWNVDPRDWALPGTAAIERGVLSQVQPGSIIISHDGGGPRGQTLAAYPRIIAALRARGYRIVTIPELLGFRPVYVPCIRLCDGLGVTRAELPRDALLRRAP
jgi:peptidoglycan/xylan/chitin deacetylase (PgdA/CDA1 family)